MNPQVWIGLACLLLTVAFVLWAKENEPERLPDPRLDCIDKGPLEHWEASEGRVRFP